VPEAYTEQVRVARLTQSLLLLFLFALAACGGGNQGGGAEEEPEDKEKPVSDQGKRWGGWRWKGKRNDCFFLYKNECYSSLEAACKQARCSVDDCVHDESAPAKVRCEN
jgi:hypothetical protein